MMPVFWTGHRMAGKPKTNAAQTNCFGCFEEDGKDILTIGKAFGIVTPIKITLNA